MKHNFSAGPSILPKEVMQQASRAVKELDGGGLSLIEISHRSEEFVAIMEEARERVIDLLGLKNKGYKALFLQGGASLQFVMLPYNLLDKKAGYINTGVWASKAIKEAKLIGEVVEIASSKDQNFNYIPKGYEIPKGLDYIHITTNNTIFGTQFKEIPDINTILVADMSSDIFSGAIDYSKFDLIYAGAQKNLGPAGVTLVIVKEDVLGKTPRTIPSMLDYSVHIKGESMFNTPPVFAIYTSLLTLRWIEAQGGIEVMEKRNKTKVEMLYAEIDRNSLFEGFATPEDRSTMNVTFSLKDQGKSASFDDLCAAAEISGLKGHRSIGGYRASIYNAMPVDSVKVLVDCMQSFEKNN